MTNLRIRDSGGVARTVKGFTLRGSGGTPRSIQRGRIRASGGTLQTFFNANTMVVTPVAGSAYASRTTTVGGGGGSKTVSVSYGIAVAGGTAPFTYAWSWVSGDVITATPTNAANLTFSQNLTGGGSTDSDYKCIVTDARGQTKMVTVNVFLELVLLDPIDIGGGGPITP